MATQTQQDLQRYYDLNDGAGVTLHHANRRRDEVWDHGTLLWSVGNDVDFLIELVRKFLISYPRALASIESSLRDDPGSLSVVEAGARQLRESLQELSAKPAADAASRLEAAARVRDQEGARAAFQVLQDEISDLAPAFDRIGEQLIRSEF